MKNAQRFTKKQFKFTIEMILSAGIDMVSTCEVTSQEFPGEFADFINGVQQTVSMSIAVICAQLFNDGFASSDIIEHLGNFKDIDENNWRYVDPEKCTNEFLEIYKDEFKGKFS